MTGFTEKILEMVRNQQEEMGGQNSHGGLGSPGNLGSLEGHLDRITRSNLKGTTESTTENREILQNDCISLRNSNNSARY